jgi:hypothetical protein
MMPLFCFSTLLAVRNIGLLHHLHWLLFLLALYFLFLSVTLLYEMRRGEANEKQTMRIAREWRQQLLALVYKSPPKLKNEETPSPRKPEFAARRTKFWGRIWSAASERFVKPFRIIVGRWTKSGQNSTKNDGLAKYAPIIFSALFAGIAVYIFMRPSTNIVTYDASVDGGDVLEVIQEYTPLNWKFHRLGDPPQITFNGHFCETYRPLFSAGMALKWLRYRDKGPCWDIQPRGFGYHIVRNGDIPVLAPNCRALTDRISCTNDRADFQGVTYDAKLLLWQ